MIESADQVLFMTGLATVVAVSELVLIMLAIQGWQWLRRR